MQGFLKKLFPVCCDDAGEATQPARFAIQKPVRSSSTRNGSSESTKHSSEWLQKDEYETTKELNNGSQGVTSVVQSKTTGKVFVRKHYTRYVSHYYGHAGMSIDRHNRLPDEARVLMKALDPHPNIVRVFGADYWPVQNTKLYLEYCTGGDLTDQLTHFMRQRRRTPEIFALHVFISLAQAFMYLHNGLMWDDEHKRYWRKPGHIPFLHGDVKCENVFLRWPEQPERRGLPDVVLGDFGAAQGASYAVGITGTTGYEAPEVRAEYDFENRGPEVDRIADTLVNVMTPATDVYSLGQVIFRTCTYKWHVCGGNPFIEPRKVGRELQGIILPEEYETGPAFSMAIAWCLTPESKDRPQMSTTGGPGIAALVGDLRRKRDSMVQRDRPLRPQHWRSGPRP